MSNRRGWVTVVAAIAVLVASCSNSPSTPQVQTAASRLLDAPRPAGAVDEANPPTGDVAERVGATNVFRTELCSDGSCPMLTLYFTPLRPESLDAACEVLDGYVRSVGGRQVEECPSEEVSRTASNSGPGSSERREDFGVVEADGEWGNVVVFRLGYSVDAAGRWSEGSDVELVLGIGRRFCGDSAIGVPCDG